ncbi:MAG: HNH endonuclease [Methanobacterium sp.]|nr:HNH endonuclease [Methanobacterium sp.]
MDTITLFWEFKYKKAKIIDELWNFTQNYLEENLNDSMECKDELKLLEGLETTERYISLIDELNQTNENLNELYIEFLKAECDGNLKKDKIIALKEKFQGEIRTSEIVKAVGCSKDYARQFKLIDGKVEQKEKRRTLSKKIKGEILKRDNYSCVVCRELKDLEIHHIMAIMGSSIKELDDHDNLVTLCKECHYLAHKGDYYKNLAYKDIEDFWKWTKNTEKTKIWLLLKDIHGIGSKITENIYDKFKSVEELQKADIRNIARVRLVNKSLATKIKFKLDNPYF